MADFGFKLAILVLATGGIVACLLGCWCLIRAGVKEFKSKRVTGDFVGVCLLLTFIMIPLTLSMLGIYADYLVKEWGWVLQ